MLDFLYLQCIDKYGKEFLGIVRFRMIILGDGDYVSSAISICPAPNSKYVIGGLSDKLALGPSYGIIQPSTKLFYDRQVCKGLELSPVHQFSHLSHDSVWTSLGPYFQAWVGNSPTVPFHNPNFLLEGDTLRDAEGAKEEQNGGNGSKDENLLTPIEFSRLGDLEFSDSQDESTAESKILLELLDC